jgi:predicted  nucleic acid-binding Zn ribbon protein
MSGAIKRIATIKYFPKEHFKFCPKCGGELLYKRIIGGNVFDCESCYIFYRIDGDK